MKQDVTTILLIRHGESEANEKGLFVGYSNPMLTSRGQKQAELTARFIASSCPADVVYSSDLVRAYATGKVIAEALGVDIKIEEGLREINGGAWEEVAFSELVTRYAEDYGQWLTDIGHAKCTEGETVRKMSERVNRSIQKIVCENKGKTIAIATHGTPIRAMQCLWSGLSLDVMKDIPWASNASVTIAEFTENESRITQISYDEHLKALRTVLPDNC